MRLVVDTDTGIDDALALILLASMPEVELVAVTTTHGNCTTEASTANAGLVLATCGLGDVPVIGGLSNPLVGEVTTSWYVHGHDGLGDCGIAPAPAAPAAPGETAVEALIDLATRNPGELDLLALGPVTNLGAAESVRPGILGAFGTVTIMGGTGPRLAPSDEDPTHGVGDPNTYHDGEAARIVTAAVGAALTYVGVDVTMNVAAGEEYLARIAAATTDHGRMASEFIRFYVDFYESRHNTRVLTLHDPIAALVAVGANIGAVFRDGAAAVDGERGSERVVYTDAVDGRPSARHLATCDQRSVSEAMTTALESPLPTR